MKKFEARDRLLADMYRDDFFPDFLVDKVKDRLLDVIAFLETGERDLEKIQEKFDEMTQALNDMQEEFEENDSEFETGARESVGEAVDDILKCFGVACDVETAIREREW